MSSPMVSIGGVQILSGIVIIVCDIISMAMFYGISFISWLGLILGVFYIFTGSLGVAGGKAAQSTGSARGLAIAALVMSILSILSSFALIIYSAFIVAVFAIAKVASVAGIVAAQLAFFIIMFIASIVMCVFAVRVISSARTTTHVTQVIHVAGQPGVVYAGGPQPYPAGQPGQYASQPYPTGQPGQYAAPYPQKA